MDWTQYAVGGATRPDSFSGMQPAFQSALAQMFANAPPDVLNQLRVKSGFRSVARQQQLWDASDKTGHMVARPGHSQHNHGAAADLSYLGPAAQKWAQANAANYGLTFPMSWEPWHVELAGARKGGGGPSAMPTSAAGGMMAPGPTAAPQMFGDLIGQNQVATTATGPMEFGQVAANLLQSAQERDRAKAETEAAETARRVALFGGADGSGLWGLYA